MPVLYKLVFAHSIVIIINLKLCSSKLYLKPDDDFGSDLQNSMDSNQNGGIMIVLPVQGPHKPNDILMETLNTDKLDEYNKLQEMDESEFKTREMDESDFDTQETDESGLEIGDLNLNNDQKDMLRKRWRSSCDKKAAKTCTSACKNAYKIVCDSFKCRRRMKKDFRKECKRNCKSQFVAAVSSETSE